MTAPSPLQEKLQQLKQLIDLRKKEEEEYGKLLTQLDELWQFSLPHEASERLPIVKDALNQIWDISSRAYSAADAEDRTFWKEVAASFHQYLEPLVEEQKEVNSGVVHLLNEYIEGVHKSLQQIKKFQSMLILYFQRVIPVIDAKFRESTGTAETFQVGMRDYMDLMYQELDKKIETLRVDVDELTKIIKSK
jgi:hypothetical protein